MPKHSMPKRFCSIQFYDETERKKKPYGFARPICFHGRFANGVDRILLVSIILTISRPVKCNIGHIQRNSPIVYAARITAFLFLSLSLCRSFSGSFIYSLRAVPLTDSTEAYVIPWKENFFYGFQHHWLKWQNPPERGAHDRKMNKNHFQT